jgi:hypothetical protein
MIVHQPTPPESLNYLTALQSMKAIRNIVEELSYFNCFFWIHVEGPFRLIDFSSLERSIHQAGTTDQVIKDKLVEIHQWAGGNIAIYNRNKDQQAESGMIDKYYRIDKEGHAIRLNSLNSIKAFGYKFERQDYCPLSELLDFCQQVYDFTGQCISHPFTSKLPSPKIDRIKPTTAQVALFFYYLAKGKHIAYPGKGSFIREELHTQSPYNFKCSGNKVYQIFIRPGNQMNKKNLSAVIPMLRNYAAAKGLAQNDLYDLLAE